MGKANGPPETKPRFFKFWKGFFLKNSKGKGLPKKGHFPQFRKRFSKGETRKPFFPGVLKKFQGVSRAPFLSPPKMGAKKNGLSKVPKLFPPRAPPQKKRILMARGKGPIFFKKRGPLSQKKFSGGQPPRGCFWRENFSQQKGGWGKFPPPPTKVFQKRGGEFFFGKKNSTRDPRRKKKTPFVGRSTTTHGE